MFLNLIERISAGVPSHCAVCRSWPSHRLCDDCVLSFASPATRCYGCAIALRRAAGNSHCDECASNPPPLDACHAAVSYGFPWATGLSRLKFASDTGWAAAFADLMLNTPWVQSAVDDADLVIPVPLSTERLAERGFNQSLEIARHLSPRKVRHSLLLRTHHTPRQSELDRTARLSNVKNAFAVDPLFAHKITQKKIVLVDDVMTTGATIFAASIALGQAGAARITAVVAARTDAPDGN